MVQTWAALGEAGIGAELSPSLEIRLEAPGGPAALAERVELHGGEATVRLAEPLAACGDGEGDVELVFRAAGLERPIRVAARVRHVIRFRDQWSYGLQFPHAGQLRETLPPRLYRLFQSSAAPRAVVQDAPIRVRVSRPGLADAWARLVDISTSGMAVDFAASEDPELASGELVGMEFDLGEEHLQLVERVRHGTLAARGARYGLEFEGALTPRFERQSDAIERFVEGAERIVRYPQPAPSAAEPVLPHGGCAPRVKPAAAVSVDVLSLGPQSTARCARLRDISISGIGVVLPADRDLGLQAGDDAVVRCELPSNGSMQLAARVRRTLLIDDEVCYGLEFDPDLTLGFERKCRAIASFVHSLS